MTLRPWRSPLPRPAPADIRQAREACGLTQSQAADVAEFAGWRQWAAIESGEQNISSQTWTLFLLRTDQHPTQHLVDRKEKKSKPDTP